VDNTFFLDAKLDEFSPASNTVVVFPPKPIRPVWLPHKAYADQVRLSPKVGVSPIFRH
jgi:hypothetical protein